MMRRRASWVLAAVLAVSLATPAAAAEPAALAKARFLYNAADYDGAIEAAEPVRTMPQWSDAATLVLARAHIERHRQREDPADLAAARDAIAAVRVSKLTPRDQVDLYIGLGQVLYASRQFGASAELFDTALGRAASLSANDRAALLEWWAMAVDRDGQEGHADRRTEAFERLASRMEAELTRDASSPVANYWLAVAARGTGDPDRAWSIAIAGWIRSAGAPAGSTARTDLDTLVVDAIIPERARARPAREQQATATALRAEWETIKQQWK